MNKNAHNFSNDDLDRAIDTAAKFAAKAYGSELRSEAMLDHLKFLLRIQKERLSLNREKE